MVLVQHLESSFFHSLDALTSGTDVRQGTAELNFGLEVPMLSVVWIKSVGQAPFIKCKILPRFQHTVDLTVHALL